METGGLMADVLKKLDLIGSSARKLHPEINEDAFKQILWLCCLVRFGCNVKANRKELARYQKRYAQEAAIVSDLILTRDGLQLRGV
jgi:hypothetical protein